MTAMKNMVERAREMVEMAPADIILQQMGGRRRLKAMIGAKDFFSENNGKTLVFRFPNRGGGKKPNVVRVTLTGRDDYDVEFGRNTRKKDKDLGFFVNHYVKGKTYNGVYADQLRGLFERETGLYLSL